MFYGLPIVTTKMGGLRGFFKDKKMGYFVEPEDVEGLEQKIEALILDSENRKRIGEFNTQYAQEHLTDSVVTDRIYTHIKEVLC
jgi:glycosyltransferase involved in cell wall biosynthesis